MPGLLGKKIGMTSIFDENGRNIPCTVIEAGPCVVTQVKTKDTDGYEAIQLAYGERREKVATKPMQGHFKKANTTPKKFVVEFDGFEKEYKLGETVDIDIFENTSFVDVAGISKGKGFQGVVKRYNFRGVGDATHGQHNRLRAPGSIGASSWPSRVFKGMRMAGQMGNARVKVQNLRLLKVIADSNLLVVKGSVPGCKGSFVIIEK